MKGEVECGPSTPWTVVIKPQGAVNKYEVLFGDDANVQGIDKYDGSVDYECTKCH